MLRKLKQIGQALTPGAIRQGLAASREALANGGRLTPEQLAALTPEQRAAYDEAMAHAQASVDQTIADARARRVLLGPAGEHLYGPLPDRENMLSFGIGAHLRLAADGFRDALSETVHGRSLPPPPAPPVSADPATQAAHERAGRDEARTPYLADGRSPVVVTRITTDPKRSLEELAAWLGSSGLSGRPDLVYGVARVPDHVPGGFGIRKSSIVEWEVVHAATGPLPAAPPAGIALFDARETWAARRAGEPGILDEDLGLEFLARAGLGPDQCLGIARRVAVDAGSGDESSPPYVMVGVTGVVVLHPAGAADGTWDGMRAARPLQVLPAPGVHVEVLNWLEVRRAVVPRPDQRAVVPSSFPYLPLTGAELLKAYLEIVGVRPSDCFSAQVSGDQPENIIGGSLHVVSTMSEKEPAADGELRRRFRGGTRVVVVYRDAPEYAEGRARWAAYQQDVLQAQLHVGTAVRGPVSGQGALGRGALGALVRTVEGIADFVDGNSWDTTELEKVPHHRYCWPPVR
ncbi:hypothetical protein L615_008300000050 [Nocardioides sp. J9]|uniref:hypothetical protein n=1 Tax=Nocardioides sp. J9 TaxID=935844 RepID=UPI00119CC596|nr:hypothetical protein [Nocardioides sp. J9]TWG91127.1 hypothetical protein L615_008300000050 [Nocardioides sp. J9]